MPRHLLRPIQRVLAGHRDSDLRGFDDSLWERLDRVQVLGNRDEGHRGCVNALSWSDDGSTLLSGSDDKRICIWGPATSSSFDHPSPHPLKLLDTISTGHRANIFSARYLPNASTPTIVSCAGDRDVRVFEVERLGRAELGGRGGEELWGHSGPGVRVLKCHTDRTKRIATENSPHLFLTVSEDGTVRQHDLRRPHTCREQCPEALFYAPRGVDLYSLSVSAVTPHLFSVAGRTDCAFVCDRRMLQRQTPSWGNSIKASGQVHCVRRLGLTNEDWKGGERESVSRIYRAARHVTCVKMSPDIADEVIVAFASHSTSLFSLYDDPQSTSARSPSAPSLSSSNPKRSTDRAPSLPRQDQPDTSASTSIARLPFPAEPPAQGEGEPGMPLTPRSRKRSRSDNGHPSVTVDYVRRARLRTNDDEMELESDTLAPSIIRAEEELREMAADMQGDDVENVEIGDHVQADDDEDPEDDRREMIIEIEDMGDIEGINGDYDEDEDEDMDIIVDEDDWMDDDDGFDADDFDDSDDDEDPGGPIGGSAKGEFGNVEMILPRRSFKGARNEETVKDCNFLGYRSDKVCSGSDDGNFFVWDKLTGRLEGIWEGDGSVVNVMEQHPTLPLIATSGIDNTVKIFASPSKPIPTLNSFKRTHLSESIIHANTNASNSLINDPPFLSSAVLGRDDMRNIIANFMAERMREGDNDGDESERVHECTSQ